MAHDRFDIRPASKIDREHIIRLISEMGAQNPEARYEWIYRSNPHGRALTWLAIERCRGQVVGCTSLFPRRMLIDGRQRTGSIGGDCYIEPRVRRRGLATALHRASFEGMEEGGVSFMYGPPAIDNLKALLKAGSRLVAECEQWVLPISVRAINRLPAVLGDAYFFRKLGSGLLGLPAALCRWAWGGSSSVTLETVHTFGTEFDRLFAQVAPAYRIIGVRDRDYLTSRYLRAPSRQQIPLAARQKGELVGFVAVEITESRASVIDLFTLPVPEIFAATLEAVVRRAVARECDILSIDCVSKSHLQPRMCDRGFFRTNAAGFQVATLQGDPQRVTLCDASAWHFTMGDTDLDAAYGGSANSVRATMIPMA